MRNDFLWVEKYRPKTVNDCILPNAIKKPLLEFVETERFLIYCLRVLQVLARRRLPERCVKNLGVIILLSMDQMKDDFLTLYGTKQRILHRPYHFKQLVNQRSSLLMRADNTTHDVQLLLRANIEAFYSNCRFIFTCNYKNKIIEPLHSRCAVVDFSISGKDKPAIAAQFFNRLRTILEEENVQYDPKVLAELINKHFLIGDVFSMSVNGMALVGLSTPLSWFRLLTLILTPWSRTSRRNGLVRSGSGWSTT